MTEAPEKIIERIKKLLALANNNPSESEAQSAMAKAQELLEAWNLDAATIGKTAQGRPRKDQKQKGGLYGWQRNLWKAVAELNFCAHWSIKGLERGSTYEHRLLGSHANVVSTQVMAEYLQQAIERLAQTWAKEQGFLSVFVKDAIAYREGMALRIVARLNDLRREKRAEAERQRRENEAASKHPAFTGSALTILDVMEDEADLNNDYMMGWPEGTTAQNRRDAAARQAAYKAEYERKQREQEEWDLAHPEEAAARKAKEKAENDAWWEEYYKKEAKRERTRQRRGSSSTRSRKPTAEEERQMTPAFQEGYRKGDDVSLHQQADHAKKERLA